MAARTITLTREQAIRRQKDLGCYFPELHPPVENPSPMAGNRSIAQSYWLAQVLEEIDEYKDAIESKTRAGRLDELVDILIFTQYLHFTTTDEPFVLAFDFDVDNTNKDYMHVLRQLCPHRKTWKTYKSVNKVDSFPQWFKLFVYCSEALSIHFTEFNAAYEAKTTYNLTRQNAQGDWGHG